MVTKCIIVNFILFVNRSPVNRLVLAAAMLLCWCAVNTNSMPTNKDQEQMILLEAGAEALPLPVRWRREAGATNDRIVTFPCNGHDYLPICLHGAENNLEIIKTVQGNYCLCLCEGSYHGPQCSEYRWQWTTDADARFNGSQNTLVCSVLYAN